MPSASNAATVWSIRLSAGTVKATRFPLSQRTLNDVGSRQRLAEAGGSLEHRATMSSRQRNA